jgi:hypothetical protein
VVATIRVSTVGGVLAPGDEVLEVVPSADTLVVEARVPPSEIAFVRVGQNASVKFDAYDSSIYGRPGGASATSARYDHRARRRRVRFRTTRPPDRRHFAAAAPARRAIALPARHDRHGGDRHRPLERVIPLPDEASETFDELELDGER